MCEITRTILEAHPLSSCHCCWTEIAGLHLLQCFERLVVPSHPILIVMASSADVIVLDDSSSDEGDQAIATTASIQSVPNKNQKSSSGSIDDETDDEELDVAPPTSKKALPPQAPSAGRPRLSSTGSSRADPVNLLMDSPALEENNEDKHLRSKEKAKQSARNTPTKRKAMPTVSLSIDSSLSSCETESKSYSNKENNKTSSERVARRKLTNEHETNNNDWNEKQASKALSSTSRFHHSSPSNSDSLRRLLESSSDDDGLLLDRKPAARKKAPPPQSNAARKRALPASSHTKSSISNPLVFDPSSSSSEDDDDEDDLSLSSSKPTARRQKTTSKTASTASSTSSAAKQRREAEKAERQRQKELSKAAKQREKQQAKEKRERERLERKQAQEAEKQQRKRAREAALVAKGKFANQEVAVLMEPSLLNHETFGIKELFEEKGYQASPYPSGLNCMAVQWIRRDYLKGGSNEAMEMAHNFQTDEFEQLNVLSVVFDSPHDFISLLESEEATPRNAFEEDDDDYPKLEEWLLGLVAGWRAAWKKTSADRPRIFLILYQVEKALHRAWVNYNRSRGGRARGPPPPNTEQLHDAILWMLIQFQIEVIHCESKEDVAKELAKMSRFIAEARYQKQTTEINCIQKLKSQVSDMAPSHDRAVDCWMRQVQQVPRVSGEMARVFVRFYPTARSLWLAYRDPELSEDEKQVLLADCFGTRTSQVKISKMMYRIMHSQNPDELLS